MFYHTINPVLLNLGHLQIRYYGLFYALGFVIGYFMICYLAQIRGVGITKDDAADLLIYLVVGVVGGSRIAYIIFYNLQYYIQNPLQIISVWNGGLSFHGGLIGAAASVYIFCRKKKINFYDLADIIVVPAALALALGRIGNFINGELYGRISELPWCVDYSKNKFIENLPSGCRHPSQIYESAKNMAIFAVLWFVKDKKYPKGFMFWSFITLYGLLRALAEFFRQPDEQLGLVFHYFTMGQILSFPLFLVGACMLFKLSRTK